MGLESIQLSQAEATDSWPEPAYEATCVLRGHLDLPHQGKIGLVPQSP